MKFEYIPVLAMLALAALVAGRLPRRAARCFGPRRPSAVKERAVRVRQPVERSGVGALLGQVLPDRHPLHRLRRRGGVPLPVGAAVPPARRLRVRRDDDLHARARRSGSSTSGARARSSGTDASVDRPHDARRRDGACRHAAAVGDAGAGGAVPRRRPSSSSPRERRARRAADAARRPRRSRFDMLTDLTAVDYLGRAPRFEVVYQLNSLTQNHRLRVKVPRARGRPVSRRAPTPLWKRASWAEREVWDLFGIRFAGHPDLRRILMYPEFEGHPLRKDYPVSQRQPLVPERDPIARAVVPAAGGALGMDARPGSLMPDSVPGDRSTARARSWRSRWGRRTRRRTAPSSSTCASTARPSSTSTSRSATCTAASRRCASRGRGTTCFPYADRLNYASPLLNNVGFALAVEKLAGITAPERCQYIRVIVGEISRITDHLTCLGMAAQRARRHLGRLLHARGARVPLRPRRGDHRRAAHRHLLPARRRHEGPAGRHRASASRAALHATCAACSPTATGCSRATASSSTAWWASARSAARTPSRGASPGRCCARPASPTTSARPSPTSSTTASTSRCPTGTRGDNYDRFLVRFAEMRAEHAHHRAGARADSRRPDHGRTTRASCCRRSRRSTARIEGLMNHFKLVIEGQKVPPARSTSPPRAATASSASTS